MNIPILTPDDKRRSDSNIVRHSSIDQYNKSPLTIIRGGVAMPISWSKIDYISCNCVVSHRVMLGDEKSVGYNFPVGRCRLTTDTYATFDKRGEVVSKLPAWAGEGYYRKMLHGRAFLNSDTNSLGVRNVSNLKIGLDYVLAEKTLEGE